MPKSEAAPQIAAVISTYRPDDAFPLRVSVLADQVAEVVVVDDGGRGDPTGVLYQVARMGATVICLVNNSGIAAAVNVGVGVADAAGYDLVVTFDQDSEVPAGFVRALECERGSALKDGIPVGSVSPSSIAGLSQKSGALVSGHERAERPIQSGTLYGQGVFRVVGPFDEQLFIDLVDTEFALRLQAAGMETLVAPGLDLPHRLGTERQMHVMGKSVTVGLSAPFRYYYRARNRVLVGTRYFRWHPTAMLREALRDFFQMSWPVAFAKQPFSMCGVIVAGVMDGLRKRGGPIPQRVASLARKVAWRGREIAG